MSDEIKKNEEQTKQESKLEDLSVEQSREDEIKGGNRTGIRSFDS